jgi:hypothetical protein
MVVIGWQGDRALAAGADTAPVIEAALLVSKTMVFGTTQQ